MKLLLVDDEEKFVARLAERLTLRGFTADWATTFEAAIDKAAATPYDLAVLDVKMPSMGGIELKNKIAEMSPGIKFIFMTGHGSEQDYEAVCKEAICCIIKPFKIEALIETIQQAFKA